MSILALLFCAACKEVISLGQLALGLRRVVLDTFALTNSHVRCCIARGRGSSFATAPHSEAGEEAERQLDWPAEPRDHASADDELRCERRPAGIGRP